jgi:hypothetical protein
VRLLLQKLTNGDVVEQNAKKNLAVAWEQGKRNVRGGANKKI